MLMQNDYDASMDQEFAPKDEYEQDLVDLWKDFDKMRHKIYDLLEKHECCYIMKFKGVKPPFSCLEHKCFKRRYKPGVLTCIFGTLMSEINIILFMLARYLKRRDEQNDWVK